MTIERMKQIGTLKQKNPETGLYEEVKVCGPNRDCKNCTSEFKSTCRQCPSDVPFYVAEDIIKKVNERLENEKNKA